MKRICGWRQSRRRGSGTARLPQVPDALGIVGDAATGSPATLCRVSCLSEDSGPLSDNERDDCACLFLTW